MPLVVSAIESKLKSAIFENLKKELTPDLSKGDNYTSTADPQLKKLANAIAKAVAKVIIESIQQDAQVAPGQSVMTSGTPSTHTGTVVSPGKIL